MTGVDPDVAGVCIRDGQPAGTLCCSSHNALLCHHCYRITHFVEVCATGCTACARENLPVILDGRQEAQR